MTTVDFELTRLHQAQRQEEAANDRLRRQAQASRRTAPAWVWCVLPQGALAESIVRANLPARMVAAENVR